MKYRYFSVDCEFSGLDHTKYDLISIGILEVKYENGEYIPGKEDNNSSYNYVVMIRLKPSCEDLLKRNKLLYSSYAQKTDLE